MSPGPSRADMLGIVVSKLVPVAGCSSPVQLSAEEVMKRGISEFHADYNRRHFDVIYSRLMEYYRSQYPQDANRARLHAQWNSFGKVVHSRIETWREVPVKGWVSAAGRATTNFEKGIAEETFSFVHYPARDEVALFLVRAR